MCWQMQTTPSMAVSGSLPASINSRLWRQKARRFQHVNPHSLLDYGDVLVDEHGQLFTPDREPIWVTRDGRHIPLTKLEDGHLAAIRDLLQEDVARHSTWIGYVDGEIARRSRAS